MEFTLVPDLIGRFALRRAPTRFPQCHGRRGREGKRKKKGKSYRIPKTRGRILFGSETRRKGEKIGRGERVFVFILCIHIYIGGEIIERGKSLEIEARCLFFFFFARR